MATKKTESQKKPHGKAANTAAEAISAGRSKAAADVKSPNPPKTPPKKPATGTKKRPRGRPVDTPDLWTPEYIKAVADDFWEYVVATSLPSVAEFCFTRGIHNQRLYEFPALVEIKHMLLAKRAMVLEKAGMKLTKAQGPRGAFILRAMANVGDFSYREKADVEVSTNQDQLAERKQMYADLFRNEADETV